MFFSKNKPESHPKYDALTITPAEIMEYLRPIKDPDIGYSIIDLGLVYEVTNQEGAIIVTMTFTTPACPYGPQLMEEIKYMLRSLPNITTADVEVVWDPPWSLDKISEGVRLEMGLDV